MEAGIDLITSDLLGLYGFGELDLPTPVAQGHARRAFSILAREAGVWVSDLTLDAQADVREYYLDHSPSSTVLQVLSVEVGDHLLSLREYHFDKAQQELVLKCAPICDEDNAVVVKVSLLPLSEECAIPDFIAAMWREALADVAAGAIHAMPGQKWSNPARAQELMRKKRAHIAEIKSNLALNETPVTANRVKVRRFG